MQRESASTSSLRAKRNNPDCRRGDGLDCFVAPLLAMTARNPAPYAAFAVTIQIAPWSATDCPFRNGVSVSRIEALAAS